VSPWWHMHGERSLVEPNSRDAHPGRSRGAKQPRWVGTIAGGRPVTDRAKRVDCTLVCSGHAPMYYSAGWCIDVRSVLSEAAVRATTEPPRAVWASAASGWQSFQAGDLGSRSPVGVGISGGFDADAAGT
jgi:hypothetical protein